MKRRSKYEGLQKRKAIAGYLFILPFIIGFLAFMVKPFFQSLYMGFCDVQVGPGGFTNVYWGLKNYVEAFTVDLTFTRLLTDELKRMAINNEACKEDRNEEKLKTLNTEMRDLYAKVMTNENMTAYNNAKTDLDTVLQRVLAIITQSAEGEDPDTTDYSTSCTHDCSTCGGCH